MWMCGEGSLTGNGQSVSRSVVSDSLQHHGLLPAKFPCLWNSPGKDTGVGCHSLLREIFLTQGSNPGLLHYRQILYQLSLQGNPIEIVDRMLNTLSLRSVCEIQTEMSHNFLAICVLNLGKK